MYDSITQNITKCQVPLLSYKNSGKTRWVVMPRIPPQAAKFQMPHLVYISMHRRFLSFSKFKGHN